MGVGAGNCDTECEYNCFGPNSGSSTALTVKVTILAWEGCGK